MESKKTEIGEKMKSGKVTKTKIKERFFMKTKCVSVL